MSLPLMLVGAGYLGWQVRCDLKADVVADTYGSDSRHKDADRWFPVTWPLLREWSRSGNEVRFNYAARAFVRRGEPYGRWWLESELRTNPSRPFPFSHREGGWICELRLNDQDVLCPLVRLSLQNMDFRAADRQFNADFLRTVLGSAIGRDAAEALANEVGDPPPARARTLLALMPDEYSTKSEVDALRKAYEKRAHVEDPYDWSEGAIEHALKSTTPEALYEAFKRLSDDQQDWMLRGLDEDDWPAPAEAFLTRLAEDRREPCRGAAAFLLWDKASTHRWVQHMVDSDLAGLGRMDSLWLVKLAENFPRSRFVRACRDYDAIRGGKYFHDYRYDEPEEPIRRLWPPADEAERWRQWLRQYPDHPGADDAGYWLGRCLEWQGRRTEALHQYAELLIHPQGDDDMHRAIWTRFVIVLDVGTTLDDLQAFLARYPQQGLEPLVRYALAVHRARQHDYSGALSLTADLTPSQILLPGLTFWEGAGFVQSGYYDQRRRWQALLALGPPNTAQHRYDLAAAWSDVDSWRNGYLILWQGWRASHFAFDAYSDDVDRTEVIPAGYRSANPMAVALALLQPVATDPATEPKLLEKTLALELNLLSRCPAYPEVRAMSPLPDFPEDVGRDSSLYQSPLSEYDTRPRAIVRQDQDREDWYARQAVAIERRLLSTFPNSRYAAQAALDTYELTRDELYLNQATVADDSWDELRREAIEGLRALHF